MSIQEHQPVPALPCLVCHGKGTTTADGCLVGEHDWKHTVGLVDGKVIILVGEYEGREVVGRGYPDWTDQWICRGCGNMRFAPDLHNDGNLMYEVTTGEQAGEPRG